MPHVSVHLGARLNRRQKVGKSISFVPLVRAMAGLRTLVHGAFAVTLATVAVLFLVTGCGGASRPSEDTASTAEPIWYGQPETGFPGVGLVTAPGKQTCTGVLINSTTVLTAGHCVGLGLGPSFTFGLGPNGDQEVQATTTWYGEPDSAPLNGFPGPGRDLGLLIFDSPFSAQPLVLVAPENIPVGKTCTAVGYGMHNEADGTITSGHKRSATEVIQGSDPDDPQKFRVWEGSGLIDHGDSGGPLICDGEVVGIDSDGDVFSDGYNTHDVFADYAQIDPHWISNMTSPGAADRCAENTDMWCCSETTGTGSSCADRTIRFNYGGAAVAGGFNDLGQTIRFGACDFGSQRNYDFVSGPTYGPGYYQIRSTMSNLCVAPDPFLDSRTVTLIGCSDCETGNSDRCLWSFTSAAGDIFELQNKASGECLYSPQGENYTSYSPMEQHACSPTEFDLTTYQRELLFLDNFPCP